MDERCREHHGADIDGLHLAFGDPGRSYLRGGEDRAPPLAWSGAPAETKSFALVVDDPDAPDPAAPKMTWVHWVVYNIPASVRALPEGGATPEDALDGLNDWKRPGWNGPCPPTGRHRYFFKLFALDVHLPKSKDATKHVLEGAMQGHVLAKAELVGTFRKNAAR